MGTLLFHNLGALLLLCRNMVCHSLHGDCRDCTREHQRHLHCFLPVCDEHHCWVSWHPGGECGRCHRAQGDYVHLLSRPDSIGCHTVLCNKYSTLYAIKKQVNISCSEKKKKIFSGKKKKKKKKKS